MVNSNSDPERAQGPVTTSLYHGGPSTMSVDKLTRRMGASMDIPEKNPAMSHSDESLDAGSNILAKDGTHRFLKSRHIQLIGIGGTIGTALYVQIGQSLLNGGPASLFLAFTIWCSVILAITVCLAEMVVYLPVSSPFIHFAGRYVDEAFGVAAGWNFFVFEAVQVPFEITACSMIIHYWSDVVPTVAIIVIVLVLYAFLNVFAVNYYGEAEFWLALGKVLLSIGLIIFTFIAMLGGNPQRDRFGFRYWQEPGSFAEYYKTGDLGRWLGFLACLIKASFTIAGPDYVSMAAGETENPRKVLPKAFNGVFYRLTSFFVLGALCVGILVPYNDPTMANAFEKDLPGAAASPYVIAMDRLGIPVLPHIVNAMVLGAAFSAGNSYVYCASRCLYGLALDNKAPRIFRKCTKNGVPIYCVGLVLLIALLAFLQVSNSASVVLNWFINLVTASQLINFSVVTFSYTRFRKALIAQNIPRSSLPYQSLGQPYIAYIAMVCTIVMAFVGGYEVFLPGKWDIPTFFFSYTMIGVFPIIFFGWKFWHKSHIRKPEEIDLKTGLDEIDEYERNHVSLPSSNIFSRFADWIFG
ncbi:amino acid permease/ SLC12A domain-containing protein [Aspergillus pseudonomiae]|uniref:Amino acid permease/ SLC12A domain-containing protein n=1 Tax=Aspergillus pseudonomiae TaxID=1506151 RepID=A0A5N6HUZ7_9EURO|nr:amino acid permease/ SLC12A domain-containing protein [Aspergillus pseudonomiae]KAB8257449.1 amino acid permease/ SLC12A domain-containing protein [Aspergillus pseudonomiae]KAE8400860.1 amino acid permease/ SLC12A domain-containing protein [Aspergillus pseudonomiae]